MVPNRNLSKNGFALILSLVAMAISLFSVVVISTNVEGKQITQPEANRAAPAVPAPPAPIIVVNHNTVNAASIPQSYLQLAAQKNVIFDHHSIGANIMTGMGTLQSQNSARYSFVSQFGPPSDWFTTHHGTGINIGEFQDGENSYPQTKIDGFDATVRDGIGNVVNIALMKFCFLDIYDDAANGLSTWNSYRTMMTNLMATYPNTKFVWTTDPLEQALSQAYVNREKSLFNNAVRQYVQTNGGTLFDLADIESHDPNGNLIVDSQGYEALYSGYAQTQDHHLNNAGQQRLASAFWWLFARLSGWDDGTGGTPVPTPTPAPATVLRGHVIWQGRTAQPNARQQLPITLTLKSATTEVNYLAQNTDASGYFTVSVSGLPNGTYNWRAKGPKYLANSGVLTLAGSQRTTAEMGLMRVGDCNNDNVVNITDYTIFRQSFGWTVGDPQYDDRADFTGDQVVTIMDFSLFKQNFNLPGAPPVTP